MCKTALFIGKQRPGDAQLQSPQFGQPAQAAQTRISRIGDRVTFTSDTLRKYFPKSYTPQRMQETIIKLLEQWQKKRQRDQER